MLPLVPTAILLFNNYILFPFMIGVRQGSTLATLSS
jgi:hypothetical protein